MPLKRPTYYECKPRLFLLLVSSRVAFLLVPLLCPQFLLAQQANEQNQPSETQQSKAPAEPAKATKGPHLRTVLRNARQQLDHYYGKIESVRLAYNKEWTPALDDAEPDQQAWDEKYRRFNINRISAENELLFTPLGQRLITTRKTSYTDGSTIQRTNHCYLQNGRRIDIEADIKQAFITTDASDGLIDLHPLHCLGLAIPGSEELRLTDLLDLPDVTRLEREEQVNRPPVVVLTIGPGIPTAKRARGWNDDTTVKVWLAQAMQYIPLKMEIYFRPGLPPYRTACRKFSPTEKKPGEALVLFPRQLDFDDGGGITHWTIQDVELHPVVQQSYLNPGLSADYYVEKDRIERGKAVPQAGPSGQLDVRVFDVRDKPIEGARVTVWARGNAVTAIRAAKEGMASHPQPLRAAVTDEQGKVVLEVVPGEDVILWADHPDMRDSRWIIGPNLKRHRIYLLPRTRVTAWDENGRALKGVELTSDLSPSPTAAQLRSYGPAPKDVTDVSGSAVLTTEYTVRRPEQPVRIVAVDDEGRAAILARPANMLEEPIKLTLRPVRIVRAAIKLDFDGPDWLPISWIDKQGNILVTDVAKRSEDEQQSRTYVMRFPLPPGSYQMILRKTENTNELTIPVEAPAGTGDVELGTFSPTPRS